MEILTGITIDFSWNVKFFKQEFLLKINEISFKQSNIYLPCDFLISLYLQHCNLEEPCLYRSHLLTQATQFFIVVEAFINFIYFYIHDFYHN